MRIVLIHGFKASGQSNWLPWISDVLKSRGHEVIAPDLPNPEAPEPEAWIKALLEAVGTVDDETIIVGHSLGGAMALRLLEAAEATSTPKACILVSTPWMLKDERFRPFFMSELDFDVLMWKASRFAVIHSKDDSIIPFNHAEKYASVLHAKLVTAENAGHFQGAQYPEILETIQAAIDEQIVYAPGVELHNELAGLWA